MEKRNNTRIIFNVNAAVEYDNKSIKGSVENLSLNGVLLNTEKKIPVKTEVNVRIMMEGTTSHLTLSLQGVVVRSEIKETAIEFTSIDLDSFIHLKNIMVYNEGNEQKIMEEFYKAKKHM